MLWLQLYRIVQKDMMNVAGEWLALLFLVWDVLNVESDANTGHSGQNFVISSIPLYKYWDRTS
jgi:hypothetical protein